MSCKPYGETLLMVLGEYLEHEDQEVCDGVYASGFVLNSLLIIMLFRYAIMSMELCTAC